MPATRLTSKDLYQEIVELKIQMLKATESQQKSPSSKEISIEFLLTEFNELGEFWRHTESRIETTVNWYITSSAAILTIISILSQQITDFRLFIAIFTLLEIALFVGGIILIRRTTYASLVKSEYLLGLNLIRRYFVDIDNSIAKYLILPSVKPTFRDQDNSLEAFFPQSKFTLTLSISRSWVSLLFGLIACSIAWLIEPKLLHIALIIIGISGFFIWYIFFTYYTIREINTFRTKLLSRIKNPLEFQE